MYLFFFSFFSTYFSVAIFSLSCVATSLSTTVQWALCMRARSFWCRFFIISMSFCCFLNSLMYSFSPHSRSRVTASNFASSASKRTFTCSCENLQVVSHMKMHVSGSISLSLSAWSTNTATDLSLSTRNFQCKTFSGRKMKSYFFNIIYTVKQNYSFSTSF